MGWALSVPIGGSAKLVLIGLANHAHPDGTEARPGVDRLATYACCDRRTVQRHLRALEADGWISVVEEGGIRDGKKRATVYEVAVGRQFAAPTESTRKGDTGVLDRAAQVPPQPSVEPSVEPSGGTRAGATVRFNGKPVDATAWSRTSIVLSLFNQAAGRKLESVTGSGSMSESAKRIYRQVVDHPEIDTAAKWDDIIVRTIASKWWGDDQVSVGAVFGPKIFEENIDRPGVPVRRNGQPATSGHRTEPSDWDRQAAEKIRRDEQQQEAEAEAIRQRRMAG